MKNKLIFISILFISNNIISMESGRTSPVLPIELDYFEKLPKNKQREVLLRLFEGIVNKKYIISTNLETLLKRLSDLFWETKNPDFNIALTKNRELLFKKMGYELSKAFNLQDLNNALIDLSLDKDKILLLLFAGADINYNNGFSTPLLSATREVNLTTMKLLIEKGADVNATISKGRFIGQTPLIRVILAKGIFGFIKDEAVKILIDAGAKVDIKDQNGKIALNYAKEQGLKDTEKMLLDAWEKQKLSTLKK
ncbi:ankyrin repeat domain-containing protein [Candidatus Dependentiae bacterium]|nr:ankyrin repeat domain-containing protein [Candidatus Dependentiae bacterium]